MELSLDFAAKLAEIIGAIAVVLSLLYVGYQVKQNTNAVRSSVHQALINHVAATEGLVLTDGTLAELIVKGTNDPSSLSPSERLRLEKYITLEFVNWENAYLNWRMGLLDEKGWRVWDRSNYPGPDLQSYFNFWTQNRDWFDDSFVQHVDAIYREQGYGSEPRNAD